jgi:para-aminobenzoate synthetase/4-amino-4-deoxychorismate lyase
LQAVSDYAAQGLWCVGFVRYEAAPAFDSACQVHPPTDGLPLAWFGVYQQALPPGSPATEPLPPLAWQQGQTREAFDTSIHTIHQAIRSGDVYQVNYTSALHASLPPETKEAAMRAWFDALRRAQPGGYAAHIDTDQEIILSVSPELFFDWRGDQLLMRPMKGTARRGKNAQDDAARADALRASPKEQAENVMIVDLVRNDISRIALPHSVKVPRLFQLQGLPTVWQMTSDVKAQTRPGTSLVDVFKALFPCGSITGAPKLQAMRLIRALEPQARGLYCGAIGVVRPGGHATFNVAIRTISVHPGRPLGDPGEHKCDGRACDHQVPLLEQQWRREEDESQRANHLRSRRGWGACASTVCQQWPVLSPAAAGGYLAGFLGSWLAGCTARGTLPWAGAQGAPQN